MLALQVSLGRRPERCIAHPDPMLKTVSAVDSLQAPQCKPSADRPLHVVVVDEELPYPPNSGKRIRTLNLLLPLASRHRIAYLAYPNADPCETREATAFLHSQNIQTMLVPRALPGKSGLGFYGRLAWNLVSPLPYSVQVHNSRALRRAIRDYALRNRVDLWQSEWTPYVHSLAAAGVRPWIVIAHNVESLIWRRYCETETNLLKRWYIRRQWKKFECFERKVFDQASQAIFVSQPDAALAREQFAARRSAVVDNGVDVRHYQTDGRPRDPHTILFLGSLDWRPNLDAVRSLLDRIFPALRDRVPDAQLLVVGRKPPRWLVDRAAQVPGVELHADVADVRPYLWRCTVMAVPLRIGGGSRLKILEALAADCPVVSTKVGAEGLCLEPGRHFLQIDAIDDMPAALAQCLCDPQAIRQMTSLGRQVVATRYDWSVLAERLEAVWLEQGGQP
ncbi:MAG: glycosyltransferase [Thermoguttaceae bacterium]